MKDIKFSPFFQKTHPRAGQPTYFIEKIWRYLIDSCTDPAEKKELQTISFFYLDQFDRELWDASKVESVYPKSHTIRSGHRFKAGEWFAPKVWTGKPYRSKTYKFAPAIEIKKVFDFEIINKDILIDGHLIGPDQLSEVAKNDGLSVDDFLEWFQYPKSFDGQIICWNNDVNY